MRLISRLVWIFAFFILTFTFCTVIRAIKGWYENEKYYHQELVRANTYHVKVLQIQNRINSRKAFAYDSLVYFLLMERDCLNNALDQLESHILRKLFYHKRKQKLTRYKIRIDLLLYHLYACREEMALMNLYNKFSSPSSEVLDLAVTLVKGCESEDSKIKRLCNFVAKNIEYQKKPVKFIREGLADSIVMHPNEVIRRGAGDCMQKSLLLLSMLNALDIEAKICMVDTDGEEPYNSNHLVVKAITEESDGIKKALIVDPTTGAPLSDGDMFFEWDFEKILSKFKNIIASSYYYEIEY